MNKVEDHCSTTTGRVVAAAAILFPMTLLSQWEDHHLLTSSLANKHPNQAGRIFPSHPPLYVPFKIRASGKENMDSGSDGR